MSLTVAHLGCHVAFIQETHGFRLHWNREDLIQLVEQAGSRRPARTTGLYHFAVLFPNRREHARAVARLFHREWENYPTDCVITKTTYLKDPEGQEIELYAESPQEGAGESPRDCLLLAVRMGGPSEGRDPLDPDALFSELTPGDALDEPVPAAASAAAMLSSETHPRRLGYATSP